MAVIERLVMDTKPIASSESSPTNSSSEPSPQATHVKLTSPLENQPTPSSPKTLEKESKKEDETILSQSTGSIDILKRQHEAIDHRRHTFSVMSADTRANMRRRSYDHTTQLGGTYPPHSPPLPHVFKTHHLQHLRVYGHSSGPTKRISANHHVGSPIISFVSPHVATVWTRGKPVTIEWKNQDAKITTLRIELLEEGLNATTLIAAEAPNTGVFTYPKVPWGMESGVTYFLRVAPVNEPERYCTSSFFQISSEP